MHPPTAELQPLGGGLQQRLGGRVRGRVAPELRAGEGAVPRAVRPPLPLAATGSDDALANRGARFGRAIRAEQLAGWLPRDQDLQIDAITDRPSQPGAVSLALQRAALTDPARVAREATGARVGRRDHDEAAGEHGVATRARHRQASLLPAAAAAPRARPGETR
jgi:hypothetical protein